MTHEEQMQDFRERMHKQTQIQMLALQIFTQSFGVNEDLANKAIAKIFMDEIYPEFSTKKLEEIKISDIKRVVGEACVKALLK